MGVLNWLTGRDAKESDVYVDFDKVETVISDLKEIETSTISQEYQTVNAALDELNSVKGMELIGGAVPSFPITEVFEAVSSEIEQLETTIQTKADDAQTYSEATALEKAGSTAAMIFAKAGEGLLSVFEDIGDGVVSVVGWLAPKDSGVEKWCEEYVKKDLAHDTFNFYYESEFAKKSAITEDSMISKAAKFGGQMGGFILLGAGISKATQAFASSSSPLLNSTAKFASNLKKIGTAEAALMGMGTGTEAGLQSGKTMSEAGVQGLKQAAIQGAIAWGIGTLAEKWANSSAKAKSEGIFEHDAGGLVENQGDDALRAMGDQLDDETIALSKSKASDIFREQGDDAFGAVSDQLDDQAVALSNGEAKSAGLFKQSVEAQRGERLEKLQSLVGDETKQAYSASLHESLGTRSRLEILADKAIRSGEYSNNPEVKTLVDDLVRENVAEYLGGTDDVLSEQINQYIIDNNLVERTISSVGDMSSTRTIQNIVEDEVTRTLIRDPQFSVSPDRILDNISNSVDKGGFNWDYKHIISYDKSQLQSGGYHKIGVEEFCSGGEYASKYVSHPTKPITSGILTTAEPHTPLMYDKLDEATGLIKTEPVTKNIYPGNFTHQQIADVNVWNARHGTQIANPGYDTIKMESEMVVGGTKLTQQTILSPERDSIVSVFLAKINMSKGLKKQLLRFL